MKIVRLNISGLFGLYDYTIDLGREDGNFTILTSPNGFGKTTILRIINSLNVKRLYFLYVLKYKSLSICFDDGSILEASEKSDVGTLDTNSDTLKDVRRGVSFVWTIEKKVICHFEYIPDTIAEAKSVVTRKTRSTLFGEILGNGYNDESFLEGDVGEKLNKELAQVQGEEQFFLHLATIQTDFIGANRIYKTTLNDFLHKNQDELPVLSVVKELKSRLSEAVKRFQNEYQRLDSKFIEKLLEGEGNEIGEDEYEAKSSSLTQKINELVLYGLVNKQILPKYDSDKAKILDVYLCLLEEKLKTYDDLLPLVRLFNKNIQQKCFANKTIRLSPQHGLYIESKNGDILRADMLSTGEQNQIVLLYDLIFRTPQGSILLIDEPESSLHVAWQNDFVNDMQTIAELKSLQIIAATHSSIIVSNTPDSCVFDLFYLQNSKNV